MPDSVIDEAELLASIDAKLDQLLARLDQAELKLGKLLAGPGAKILKMLGG